MLRLVALLLLMLALSGCATVETWEGLARAEIYIKDISVSCSNDVACAVSITGEKYVSVVPSVMTRWDSAYEESFDVCNSNEVRVITNECSFAEVNMANQDVVVVSGEQWMDDDYLVREVLQKRSKCDFGIVIVDLNRYRRFLAVPRCKHDLPGGREEWSFVVLEDPVINFYESSYVMRENNIRVILCRSIYTPVAVVFDIVTLPFQVCLGLFSHM